MLKIDILGWLVGVPIFFKSVISACFIIGLLFIIIPVDILRKCDSVLTKEYGFKKVILPLWETKQIQFIHAFVLNHLPSIGLLIMTISFCVVLTSPWLTK